MAIKNPFGVGDSGALAREVKIKCECCSIHFVVIAGPRSPIIQRRCVNCLPHNLGGDAAHRADALEDHANRSLELAERAYDQLRRGMQERDEALEERKRFGQMLYQANEDRDALPGERRS